MTDIRAALDAIGRGWTGMDGTFSMKNEDAQIVAGALTALAASPPKADAIDKALAQGFTDGWNAAASPPTLDVFTHGGCSTCQMEPGRYARFTEEPSDD